MELELNPSKCELAIINHINGEEIQTFWCFKELVPKFKLVPAAKSFLLGTPIFGEGISVAMRENVRTSNDKSLN